MLLSELIKEATGRLCGIYPEREASGMVLSYLESSIGTKRYTHIIEPEYQVEDVMAERCLGDFRRMASGEPLQYVTGKSYFFGREFRVTPSVLIPRPETELLVSAALEMSGQGNSLRVLDMCTGSGCIAWTMAMESPGTVVTAVDISDEALEVASSQDFNEEICRTGAIPPSFIKADVLGDVPTGFSGFDMILSNPPYVMDKEKQSMRMNVLEHEPHLALFVPDDDPLKFYEAVARWAFSLLSPDGIGIVEINEALGQETAQVFLDHGFATAEVRKDLSDRDRFVVFRR